MLSNETTSLAEFIAEQWVFGQDAGRQFEPYGISLIRA